MAELIPFPPFDGTQDRVNKNPNITVHLNTSIVDAVGNNKNQMSHLRLRDSVTGAAGVAGSLARAGRNALRDAICL